MLLRFQHLRKLFLKGRQALGMLQLHAQTRVLPLHARKLMTKLAFSRRRLRGGVLRVLPPSPAPPLSEVRGEDPLAAKEKAELTMLGAAISKLENAELLLGGKPSSFGLVGVSAHSAFGFRLGSQHASKASAPSVCARQ